MVIRRVGFVEQNHTVGLLAGNTSFWHELTSCTHSKVEGTPRKKTSEPQNMGNPANIRALSHLASKSYTHLRYPSNLVSKTFTDQVAQTNLTRPGQDGGPRLGPQDHSPSRSCRPVNHMGVESCFPIDAGGEFSTPANTHGPLSTRILRICPKSL